MTIDEKIYSVLSGSASLANLVDDRVYPVEIPLEVQEPCVRYFQVSGTPLENTSGTALDEDNRFQFDVYSTELHEAKQIQAQISMDLRWSNLFQASVISSLTTRKENEIYIVTTDYRIFNI